MDCVQDLEFNDDVGRTCEKVKESIHLTQRKMLRSHELIVQYNNKRKECERLKADLTTAQEEVTKLKRESSLNLSNMVKLEMQSASYKKNQQELEQKIVERDIQIASDKSHLEQLKCKLEDLEEKHTEKVMEAELVKSGLEVNVKELEQELRALKKSHESEINRLERTLKSPAEKRGKKSKEVAKETREMGVNTVEEVEPPQPPKPEMADKSVLTNEFYHIRLNPYPLFCDRCESIVEQKVEKICKAVVHPTPISNDIPPVWFRGAERERPNCSDSSSLDANRLNGNPSNVHRIKTTRLEPNSNEFNLVDPSPGNFVSPLPPQSASVAVPQEAEATAVDAVARECDSLRREVATLKRKLKTRRTQKSSDSQPVNCCSHSHPVNYCGHSSAHANPLPSVFPNVQVDLMAEFVNRMMNLANECNSREKATKVCSQYKERSPPVKKAHRVKSRKFKRTKVSKKSKNCGSGSWDVDSSDCAVENDPKISADPSDPTKPHLLRVKRRHVADSPIAPFNDSASEKLSSVSDPWEASFAETQPSSSGSVEKPPEKARRPESDFDQGPPVQVPIATKVPGRKRGRPPLRRQNPQIEDESTKSKIIVSARCKSSRNVENATKSLPDEKFASVPDAAANSFENSAPNDLSSISTIRNASDLEIDLFSPNSAVGEPAPNSRDAEHSDAPLENVSDSESYSECTNLRDRVEMRKRKRSGSPKATKRTGRKNLMGKLRALKKNSIMTVAKTSNSSATYATRSSSRRKSTELSLREDSEEAPKEGKRASSVSRDDPSVCLPVKKQRIAHVPKMASSSPPYEQEMTASSRISKPHELSEETHKIMDENSTDDRATAATERPLTRRLAVERLAQSNTKNEVVGVKGPEIGRVALPASVTEICRRARLPTKRNAAADAQQSLLSHVKKVAAADAPERVNKFENAGETATLPKVRGTGPNDYAKSTEGALEGRTDDKNSTNAPELVKIPKFTAAELAQIAESSAVHSNKAERSMTPSIFTADAPVDESELARALPAEKPSDSLDASSASPAASLDSTLSPRISTSAASIEETNELGALPPRYDNSENESNSAASDETRGSEGHDTAMLSGVDSTNKAISTIPDESPASPSSSPASPDMTSSTPRKMTEAIAKTEERLSIYDSAVLPVSLEEEDADSTSLSNFADPVEETTSCLQLSLQNISKDMSIEKTLDESLSAHDASSHDDSEEDSDEYSKNMVIPQFFVEASDAAKENSTQSSNGFVEPINTKELRSRLVLCSPTKSPSQQSLQRTPSSPNDEAQTAVLSGARVSRPECYSRVRNLGTMLNHHLGEQKNTNMTQAMTLRKAAAIKLQETVEQSIKSELVKLVESDEWTSELHQSVVTKLLDTRSEHSVAKSITDFLIERASLDEPLDQTYTPPAPIMTKCQQKIVTLVTDLARDDAMPRMFDLVQAGVEYNVFKLGDGVRSVEDIEYLIRIFTVISRIRKDRERVRILCCDVFYFLGRRALPVIHVILTIWPEVMPKHGTVGNELTNCFAHLIKVEVPGKVPFPKVMAVKKMITSYYEYPHFQAQSDVVMKVLLKALHEKYSSDLETSILLISKREGNEWALNNVVDKGLMTIIRDDSYKWQFEAVSLLGFLLRCFSAAEVDKTLPKYVNLLCQILNTCEGSHDRQEGALSALLSLSRFNSFFVKISDSILKWTPSRGLRASTMEQLHSFFDSHKVTWWKLRDQYKMNMSGKNN